MAEVIITRSLAEEIDKKFKQDSIKIFDLMYSLKDNPLKGKPIASVGNILVKEIRYGKFRFYFIMDRYKIKILKSDELREILIKFVRMSDKKTQQNVIDEIKKVLASLGQEGF